MENEQETPRAARRVTSKPERCLDASSRGCVQSSGSCKTSILLRLALPRECDSVSDSPLHPIQHLANLSFTGLVPLFALRRRCPGVLHLAIRAVGVGSFCCLLHAHRCVLLCSNPFPVVALKLLQSCWQMRWVRATVRVKCDEENSKKRRLLNVKRTEDGR